MSTDETKLGTGHAPNGKVTDARVIGAELYLLPVKARVPLRFGAETLTSVTCARVRLWVVGRDGRVAEGWGETPLSVQWTWPSALPVADRREALVEFCKRLAISWASFEAWGHPLELGNEFQKHLLPELIDQLNGARLDMEPMPHLAGLVCCSAFDIALHDAYGVLHEVPTYSTYRREYMNHDLAAYFGNGGQERFDFSGKYPSDYLVRQPATVLPVWHLVGALDPIEDSELDGNEPKDDYPLVLADWIRRDGLVCLKVKLRGNDAEWDYNRLLRVGRLGRTHRVRALTVDFNGTVHDPEYVNDILDRLNRDEAELYEMIEFVEQPFPADLDRFPIDVRSVSRRKPLLMDESASDWKQVERGAALGWTGVALKTCKTQTGVLLSFCWARAHNLEVMVQDLTNPMLAQIPHVLLAAHAGSTKGVESNAMQFYPEASWFEAKVHPGLYARQNGQLDLSTVWGSGFGYRIDEINRPLLAPVIRCGETSRDGNVVNEPHFLVRKARVDHPRPTS